MSETKQEKFWERWEKNRHGNEEGWFGLLTLSTALWFVAINVAAWFWRVVA